MILLKNINHKTFFQPEVGEMAIDETFVQEWVQNLCITGWTIIEEKRNDPNQPGFWKNPAIG
jgi:hypothetical protein